MSPTEQPLFDMPRQVPPGAYFAIRRTDGQDIGVYEQIAIDDPDDWSVAVDETAGASTPVEFEVVMWTPTSIGTRTFGVGSLRAEGSVA